MPSTFTPFDVLKDTDDGLTSPVPNAVVKVYDADAGAALPDLAADAFGHVAAAVLPVDAGTLVRFRVDGVDGMSGFAEQVTV